MRAVGICGRVLVVCLALAAASILPGRASAELIKSANPPIGLPGALATVGFYFHELGHALLHELDIPFTGREEDAVDEFATLVFIDSAKQNPDVAIKGALAFAEAFYRIHQSGQRTPYWDEHTYNIVRFGNVVCLLYGFSPKDFDPLMDKLQIPAERRQRCVGEYPRKMATWENLLKGHTRAAGAQGAGAAAVEYGKATQPVSQQLEAMWRQSAYFENQTKKLSEILALPRAIKVVPGECGFVNAYWNPNNQEIHMCYEFMTFLDDLMNKPLAGDPPANTSGATAGTPGNAAVGSSGGEQQSGGSQAITF